MSDEKINPSAGCQALPRYAKARRRVRLAGVWNKTLQEKGEKEADKEEKDAEEN